MPNTGATQHWCCRQRAQPTGSVAAVAGSTQAVFRALEALTVPLKADLRILTALKAPLRETESVCVHLCLCGRGGP